MLCSFHLLSLVKRERANVTLILLGCANLSTLVWVLSLIPFHVTQHNEARTVEEGDM